MELWHPPNRRNCLEGQSKEKRDFWGTCHQKSWCLGSVLGDFSEWSNRSNFCSWVVFGHSRGPEGAPWAPHGPKSLFGPFFSPKFALFRATGNIWWRGGSLWGGKSFFSDLFEQDAFFESIFCLTPADGSPQIKMVPTHQNLQKGQHKAFLWIFRKRPKLPIRTLYISFRWWAFELKFMWAACRAFWKPQIKFQPK